MEDDSSTSNTTSATFIKATIKVVNSCIMLQSFQLLTRGSQVICSFRGVFFQKKTPSIWTKGISLCSQPVLLQSHIIEMRSLFASSKVLVLLDSELGRNSLLETARNKLSTYTNSRHVKDVRKAEVSYTWMIYARTASSGIKMGEF